MASRLRPEMPFGKQVTRIASEELAGAIQILTKRPNGIHKSIHEARRAFKRVRGLCRLAQAADSAFFRKKRSEIAVSGQSLSMLRDASALVESCQRQQAFAFHDETAAAFQRLLDRLIGEHSALSKDIAQLEKTVEQVISNAKRLQTDFDLLKLDFDAQKAAKILRKGWCWTLAKAQQALHACSTKPNMDAFHDLRKATQSHVQQTTLLLDLWPSVLSQRQKDAKMIADLLGEDHDLGVLLEKCAEVDPAHVQDHYLLEISIHERQAHLRSLALSRARALFSADPEFEANRIALLWRHDASRKPDVD